MTLSGQQEGALTCGADDARKQSPDFFRIYNSLDGYRYESVLALSPYVPPHINLPNFSRLI